MTTPPIGSTSSTVLWRRLLAPARPLVRAIRHYRNPPLAPYSEVPYATHLPVLLGLGHLLHLRRIVEFGCGDFSTVAFLDRAAFPEVVSLASYENHLEWHARVAAKVAGDPRVTLSAVHGLMHPVVASAPVVDADLVFIDDSFSLEERAATIRDVARRPGRAAVVIHDFEQRDYQEAAAAMPHRFRFTAFNPNTGVAWDGAPLHERQLRRLNRLLAKHAARVRPDDIGAWVRLIGERFPR